MATVDWSTLVNNKAYGLDISSGSNIIETEFESGKKRNYLKNSVGKKVFSFNLWMEDVGQNSEFKMFVLWWDNVLQSGANFFRFPDLLGRNQLTEYRITDQYSARGQAHKEISLSVEEV